MPNQRAENQTRMVFALDQALLDALDAARPAGVTRSQMVRNAIVTELERLGYAVDPSIVAPPDRTGKGGPARKAKATRKKSDVALVAEAPVKYVAKPKK